jgi:hypothetical protein
MCRNNGVGMSAANDLAVAEAEPPTGGDALTDLLCAVFSITSCMPYYFLKLVKYRNIYMSCFLYFLIKMVKIYKFLEKRHTKSYKTISKQPILKSFFTICLFFYLGIFIFSYPHSKQNLVFFSP